MKSLSEYSKLKFYFQFLGIVCSCYIRRREVGEFRTFPIQPFEKMKVMIFRASGSARSNVFFQSVLILFKIYRNRCYDYYIYIYIQGILVVLERNFCGKSVFKINFSGLFLHFVELLWKRGMQHLMQR